MNARIEKYLIVYNALQLLCWTVSFVLLFWDFGYAFIGICIAQTLSIAEIVHAGIKWSRSPLLLTFLQVAARLLLLYLIYKLLIFAILGIIPGLAIVFRAVFLAWSLAELIRYGYYLSLLINKTHPGITWLRYSAFIVCYPVGLAGELYIIYQFYSHAAVPLVKILMILVILFYALGFPMLYLHLWKQRRLKIQAGATTPTSNS